MFLYMQHTADVWNQSIKEMDAASTPPKMFKRIMCV